MASNIEKNVSNANLLSNPIFWVFLIILGLARMAAVWNHVDTVSNTPPKPTSIIKLASLPKRPAQRYDTGELAGRKVCDLCAEYLALTCKPKAPAVIPATLAVNWDQTLTNLWLRKVARAPHNPVVSQTSVLLVREYLTGDRGLTTFEAYKHSASTESNRLWLTLDWDRVGAMYYARVPDALAARKLKLLRDIAGQVRGRDLMSYGAAELMPSGEGRFNRAFIDFILRNGGSNWFERVPAEHDGMTSYGFFQFTSFALYDVRGVRRGASKPNQALPKSLRIPGSVIRLRGHDHFRAAYLFAVDNLAEFILRLNPRELATFERVWRTSDRSVAEFVALAHHSPGTAYGAGRRWLDHGGRSDFAVSTSRIAHIYAAKAAANYDAFE